MAGLWRGRAISLLVTISMCAAALAGCGSKETKLPDLSGMGEVSVISREEGSGTRSEFESRVDTEETGTTKTAPSSEDVVDYVKNDKNAIGYVSYNIVKEDSGVRLLNVDGKPLNEKTIRHGTYPLTRSFYLAYSGDLTDIQRDFLTYVLSAGQSLVGDIGIPEADTKTFLSGNPEGQISVCGSTSMGLLLGEMADDYMSYNPNAAVSVTTTDSTDGVNEVLEHKCDFAMVSRSAKSYEKELLTFKAIALDGVAVIVNPDNPMTDISLKQLKSIYDGDTAKWEDLK
ncbi:MAG: substrate-binding domain-containing protein [Chordicoccus sp.]